MCARLFVDPQNCARAQQLGACWHWAKVGVFDMRPNHRCAPLCLAKRIFEWWAEGLPHSFCPLLGNSLLRDYSPKRLYQTPTSHEQPSFPCCTEKILKMWLKIFFLLGRHCKRQHGQLCRKEHHSFHFLCTPISKLWNIFVVGLHLREWLSVWTIKKDVTCNENKATFGIMSTGIFGLRP